MSLEMEHEDKENVGTEHTIAEEPAANGEASKERLKKAPKKPDDTEYKAQMSSLNETIQAQKARIEQIKQSLQDLQQGRRGVPSEQQQCRQQLNELRGKFQAELRKKQSIRAELEAASKARNDMREQLRSLKSKISFTSVEKVDEQRQRLADRLKNSTLSITEERKTLEDLKRLNESRDNVEKYKQEMEGLNGDDAVRNSIMERLRACDERLNEIKAEEEQWRSQLNATRSEQDPVGASRPALQQEWNDCRLIIDEANKARQKLRADHQAAHDEYYSQQQQWREQMQESRQKKQQEWAAEQKERDAQRKAREQELSGPAYYQEVTRAEQLLGYLSKWAPSDTPSTSSSTTDLAAPDGYKIIVKRDLDEELGLSAWAGGKPKSKSKSKGRGGPAAKAAGDARAASTGAKLTHSLDILDAFTKLKVEVPMSTSQVPAIIDAVKARLDHYLQQRARKEAGEEVEAEEPAPAAAKPAAGPAKAKENGSARDTNGLNIKSFPSLVPTSRVFMACSVAEDQEHVTVSLEVDE